MSREYAAMCGYTEDEIEEYFHERLAKIALEQETDYDDLNRSIKDWYDGYRFSRGEQRVYNPVSFTKFLSEDGEFSNYWFATGTPSILVRLFKENCVDFEKLFSEYQMEDVFTAFMPAKVKFVALMYQTGYLTIKDTKTILKRTTYKLGFPNIEVEESFYRYLFSELNNKDGLGDSLYLSLIDALTQNDIDKMMSVIDAYLADLPYGIQIAHEKYYQTIFYLLFNLIGTTIHTEVQTSDGRIDAVIEYEKNVYIFEFMLNKTEEIAFDQIMEKQYYKAYQHLDKQITLIGANFNSETRRISGWKKQELKK